MSGGKGGEQKQELPKWLDQRSQALLERADKTARLGYMPYYGPDVAAINPMEAASMRGAGAAATAFGLHDGSDVMAGMPEAQTFAGGVQGYSSAPLYEQSIAELQQRAPGIMDQYKTLFVDPAPGVDSMYYDPSNPEHQEVMQQQPQYPPGYEWMRFLQEIPSGGGFV